ncbi:hypothetical protein FAGAP_2077 [Fusarium agapanthi]|uniref:Uncharacterized protein n=1 Tax=Fusarium agapanthi TaxID=1803897 RepID=A0A9P5BN02_9HYPO|nr:hypothetical protein FAGAP_2077 [Fusarium agapanthi]
MIVGGIPLVPLTSMHVFSAFLTGVIPCPEVWVSNLHMNLFPGLVLLIGHQLFWVDMGHPDVCQNSLCGESRRPGRNAFRGFGPESRCVACYKHRIKYGEEDPNPHGGKPFAKRQEWLDQENHDVYGTCHELRPDESHLLGWTGWLDASKCARCTKNARPTNDYHATWVEEQGDTCAFGILAKLGYLPTRFPRAATIDVESDGSVRDLFKDPPLNLGTSAFDVPGPVSPADPNVETVETFTQEFRKILPNSESAANDLVKLTILANEIKCSMALEAKLQTERANNLVSILKNSRSEIKDSVQGSIQNEAGRFEQAVISAFLESDIFKTVIENGARALSPNCSYTSSSS